MLVNYFNPFISVKVMDGLFICNQTAVKDQQFLLNNKFSLIVNTCPKEFKVLPLHNVYKVTNFHWANSKNQLLESINISIFKPIFDEIATNLEEGHGTLVVSERGHSRAITFILLFLMTQFQWQLLKSLEYINSKRQNLSVRATYLKLLVNYQKNANGIQTNKAFNGQCVQKNKTQQNDIIHSYLKSSTKQKWKNQQIKSDHEQLITNTFKNTIKKKRINDINLQYQQIINNSQKNERKSLNSDKRYRSKDQKTRKSLKFSNQIQIISGQCSANHNFPQYGQLESEGGNRRAESHRPNSNQQKQLKPAHTTHLQSSIYRQSLQTPQSIQKHRIDDSITKREPTNNIRLINLRKKQHQNLNQQKSSKPEIIQFSNDDLYDRGLHQNQTIEVKNQNPNQPTQLAIYSNQYLPLTSCMKTQKQTQKEDLNSIRNSAQLSSNKSGQFNPHKKTRLSSYKKLKASMLEGQIKNAFSPLKRQHKQIRVQTQPKNDNQTNNLTTESVNKKNVHKRLSISQNSHARPFIEGIQLSHQRKSLSLAIQMKPMSIIERMSIQKGKQKRCQTPQLDATQNWLINNNSQSNHNNLIGRSRGKNSSMRVNKKSGQSQCLDKRIQKEQGNNNIFNVNINVNIGKLQMFSSLNGQQMSIKGMKNNANLFKINNQFDKMGFINSKPRSNSTNSYYPKTTSVQVSTQNHRESGRNKITQKMTTNHNRNINKNINKHIQNSQDNQVLSNKNISTFATSFEDLNLGASDSFSKQQIMNKINKKLIHHNQFQNNQQTTKNPIIKRNNFI